MAQTRMEAKQRKVKKTQATITRNQTTGAITRGKGRVPRANKKAYPGKYGYGPEVRVIVA